MKCLASLGIVVLFAVELRAYKFHTSAYTRFADDTAKLQPRGSPSRSQQSSLGHPSTKIQQADVQTQTGRVNTPPVVDVDIQPSRRNPNSRRKPQPKSPPSNQGSAANSPALSLQQQRPMTRQETSRQQKHKKFKSLASLMQAPGTSSTDRASPQDKQVVTRRRKRDPSPEYVSRPRSKLTDTRSIQPIPKIQTKGLTQRHFDRSPIADRNLPLEAPSTSQPAASPRISRMPSKSKASQGTGLRGRLGVSRDEANQIQTPSLNTSSSLKDSPVSRREQAARQQMLQVNQAIIPLPARSLPQGAKAPAQQMLQANQAIIQPPAQPLPQRVQDVGQQWLQANQAIVQPPARPRPPRVQGYAQQALQANSPIAQPPVQPPSQRSQVPAQQVPQIAQPAVGNGPRRRPVNPGYPFISGYWSSNSPRAPNVPERRGDSPPPHGDHWRVGQGEYKSGAFCGVKRPTRVPPFPDPEKGSRGQILHKGVSTVQSRTHYDSRYPSRVFAHRPEEYRAVTMSSPKSLDTTIRTRPGAQSSAEFAGKHIKAIGQVRSQGGTVEMRLNDDGLQYLMNPGERAEMIASANANSREVRLSTVMYGDTSLIVAASEKPFGKEHGWEEKMDLP